MTRVISISDDAYNRLRKLKGDKSFSQVIVNLALEKHDNSILEFAGELSKEEADKIKREIKRERKISSRRFR